MTLMWEAWGIAAGIIVCLGYAPQIIKAYKTKKLEDLSYLFNIMIGFGMFMWMVYGIVMNSLAIIATNVLGVALNLTLTFMKFFYSKKQTENKICKKEIKNKLQNKSGVKI